jgi:hypothetical protein
MGELPPAMASCNVVDWQAGKLDTMYHLIPE